MVVTEIEACQFRGLREDAQWDLGDLIVLNAQRLEGHGRGVARKRE